MLIPRHVVRDLHVYEQKHPSRVHNFGDLRAEVVGLPNGRHTTPQEMVATHHIHLRASPPKVAHTMGIDVAHTFGHLHDGGVVVFGISLGEIYVGGPDVQMRLSSRAVDLSPLHLLSHASSSTARRRPALSVVSLLSFDRTFCVTMDSLEESWDSSVVSS